MRIGIIRSHKGIPQSITDSFYTAFRKLGHDVILINENQNFDYTQKDINEIKRFNPQFVIAYGFNGMTQYEKGYILRNMKIPLISIFYDNPMVGLDENRYLEMKENPKYYINFIWDSYYLEQFNNKGIKNNYKTMLAVNEEYFLDNEKKVYHGDICFIGDLNLQDSNITLDSKIAMNFIETVINIKAEDLGIPVTEICFDLFKNSKFAAVKMLYEQNEFNFWNIIYMIIQRKGSPIIRQYYLSCIEDIKIHLFGTDKWNKNNLIFHPHIKHGNLLSDIYQNFKININISALQLEKAVNNRVFDVFACGAFLITDYKEDLEAIFPNDWEKITFRNLYDYGEKIEYYLKNEDERKQLSKRLKEIILTNHTYINRAKEILRIVSNL
ncbi:MAG: glycosyltransferase [Clostridiaceae bacterium]